MKYILNFVFVELFSTAMLFPPVPIYFAERTLFHYAGDVTDNVAYDPLVPDTRTTYKLIFFNKYS